MKKRTKRKIHNRIIKKLISGQPLSGFDKKYHESMVRKVYVAVNSEKKKPVYKMTITEQTQSAADAISNFGKAGAIVSPHSINIERISDHCSNQTIMKPSKWERVKSRVKGWFRK
ncbi:hypothetical protein ACQKKE_05340 [Desemzia incerta]|uniref:hypothetical protein n=1 Tax=Desemzia incerta TaxID=82801 RepID=UPI003CFDC794